MSSAKAKAFGKTILPSLGRLNNEFRIILASGSPRRKELLSQMGLTNFEVVVSKFEEDLDKASFESPAQYCLATSFGKLQATLDDLVKNGVATDKDMLMISADTIIEIEGTILEKPVDERDALNMLTMLSGKTHVVHTAVNMFSQIDACPRYHKFIESTQCTFIDLSVEDIKSYVGTGEGVDKSGSYGIQGIGGQLVHKINGCYYNVMGLPINSLSMNIAKILRGAET